MLLTATLDEQFVPQLYHQDRHQRPIQAWVPAIESSPEARDRRRIEVSLPAHLGIREKVGGEVRQRRTQPVPHWRKQTALSALGNLPRQHAAHRLAQDVLLAQAAHPQ